MSSEPVSSEPAFDPDQSFDGDHSFDDAGLAPSIPTRPSDAIAGWSTPPLIVGAAFVAIAVSGLLDDTGVAEHPYWVVPALCLLGACAAVAGRTMQRLLATGP